jgi:glycosyltransferase involved in cell wall biosynthesis
MEMVKVSVIIPAYNGAETLEETVQSVLDQTYRNFEIIIVDDDSKDNTAEIVQKFNDSRIRYIKQAKNRGANAARNTGLRASTGDVIAYLDQDDLFHPEKLQVHVEYLENHPEIGFTFNPRFELNHSASTIRELFWPPEQVQLADLVLNYTMSPSEMVIRRDWALTLGYWDEEGVVNGGEIILTGRLYLSGCKFGNVMKVLNYRRFHSRRTFRNIKELCMSEVKAREIIFSDPRCPEDVRAVRTKALTNAYLDFSAVAFAQEETALGQELIRELVKINPSVLQGEPSMLLNFLLFFCTKDESLDHGEVLRRFFDQLPQEIAFSSNQYDWAVGRGYLIRGVRAVIWDCEADGRSHFARAAERKADVDTYFIGTLVTHLLNYDSAFGEAPAHVILSRLEPYLAKVGGAEKIRRLKGDLAFNKAFQMYQHGTYKNIPNYILQAVIHQPVFLFNRGLHSVLIRSILKRKPYKMQHSPS